MIAKVPDDDESPYGRLTMIDAVYERLCKVDDDELFDERPRHRAWKFWCIDDRHEVPRHETICSVTGNDPITVYGGTYEEAVIEQALWWARKRRKRRGPLVEFGRATWNLFVAMVGCKPR